MIPKPLTGTLMLVQCTGKKPAQDLAADPQTAEAVLRARTMGLAYLEENDLDNAAAEFQKPIRLAPGEAIGYANLGLAYLRMGSLKEAEEALLKALELDPGTCCSDIQLFLNGRIFPADASINTALSQGANEKVVPPMLQVINDGGAFSRSVYTFRINPLPDEGPGK